MSSPDLEAALIEAGLSHADLIALTGADRRTVWRWRKGKSPVPSYVWTIIKLQGRVRGLTEDLANY